MIRSVTQLVIAGVGAVWLLPPALAAEQTSAADVSRQTGETWNTIKAYSQDRKNEAVAYGKELLKEADASIARMESNVPKISAEAKARYDKEVNELKVTRANTAIQLEKMERASGGAWNDAKQGFADAYKDLERARNKVIGQFK